MDLRVNQLTKISAKHLNVFYGQKQALFDVSLDINQNEVTALIGPSGCGKSTFIRCINRMNDVIDFCKIDGEPIKQNKLCIELAIQVIADTSSGDRKWIGRLTL